MKRTLLQLFWLLLPTIIWAQFSIEGSVIDQRTGKPIPGAEAAIYERGQVKSASQAGVFRFSSLQDGSYTLRVSANGYLAYVQKVEVRSDLKIRFELRPSVLNSEEVMITATRASDRTGTTYSELGEEQIAEQNFGQDMPFLLNQLPSTVVTSDAGTGIGYTGIRIRGSDPTRINVTINGIPVNDAESHGVFWVDLPDLASSVDNIQVQRGVGTTTNGAAAFGASINIQTDRLNDQPYGRYDGTVGSFNTWKHTLRAGTGLIGGRFAFDVRLSRINSDGYVDRATADISSWYASGAWYGNRTKVRFVTFSGKERTYQSWWGLPEDSLETNRTWNYYTYDNQIDNYQQDYYQLIASHSFNDRVQLEGVLHYTRGFGYFEQYEEDQAFTAYPGVFDFSNLAVGLPGSPLDTITSTDLIRQRWLDNDFYGVQLALQYKASEWLDLTFGGGASRYDGDHFGEVIWARWAATSEIRDRYYESRGLKDDYHAYAKALVKINSRFGAYVDVQARGIDYQLGDARLQSPGTDTDQQQIWGDYNFFFFNPKVGLTYNPNTRNQIYASFAMSSREPVRTDIVDAPNNQVPTFETLRNVELGYRFRNQQLSLSTNLYLMDYVNQLVVTGRLNDVGAPLRENVEDSYRMGWETELRWKIIPGLTLNANLALSQNKIAEFTEVLYDYADGSVVENSYTNTDIALSPSIVGGGSISWRPWPFLEATWLHKYVGRQYLDNTSMVSRSLDPFYVSDFRLRATLKPEWMREFTLGLQVNNLFDAEYEPNGYTFSYLFGGELFTENYYYPQAGTNFMFSVGVEL